MNNFICGITGLILLICVVLIVFYIPHPTLFQQHILKIVIAISGGLFSMLFENFITFNTQYDNIIRFFVVFCLIYFGGFVV